MKLVVIIGPQAVGKMTVGHELEKITGLKLFHNHSSIEVVLPYFSYGTEQGKHLVKVIREEIFKAFASSDNEGLIFTYVCYFDRPEDSEYLEELVKIFRDKNAEIYYVELEADIEERLKRNITEHRLNHKPSKRDTERTENEIKKSTTTHRVNSDPGEVKEPNYLRINNTEISASEAAQQIKEHFNL